MAISDKDIEKAAKELEQLRKGKVFKSAAWEKRFMDMSKTGPKPKPKGKGK